MYSRAVEPDQPDPQGFYSNNWEEDPASNSSLIATEQRGGPASHPAQALDTTMPITPPIQGGNGQHTLKKDVAGIHTKNSPCTKDTGHT